MNEIQNDLFRKFGCTLEEAKKAFLRMPPPSEEEMNLINEWQDRMKEKERRQYRASIFFGLAIWSVIAYLAIT